MTAIRLVYHAALLIAVIFLLRAFAKKPVFIRFLRFAAAGLGIALFLGFFIGDALDRFFVTIHGSRILLPLPSNIRLFSEGIFVEGTLFIFLCGILFCRKAASRGESNVQNAAKSNEPLFSRYLLGGILIAASWGIAAIGIDAYWIEPQALTIRRAEFYSPKIHQKVRMVLASDFQADRFGPYEDRAIQLIKEQKADLILLGGDYYQYSRDSVEKENTLGKYWRREYGQTIDLPKELRNFWLRSKLSAPLGVYAVGGTAFREPYEKDNFQGTGIYYFEKTATFPIGEDIVLTGLSNVDTWRAPSRASEVIEESVSRFWAKNESKDDAVHEESDNGEIVNLDSGLNQEPNKEKECFHIILGHAPYFFLANPCADLLLAGHTHGGQIQIPGFGPIFTVTQGLPRAMATGLHSWTDAEGHANWAIVTHGVGMERAWAPRVRLFCRPDIWVIDLYPSQKTSSKTED